MKNIRSSVIIVYKENYKKVLCATIRNRRTQNKSYAVKDSTEGLKLFENTVKDIEACRKIFENIFNLAQELNNTV